MTYVGALPNESGALFRAHLNAALQDLARWFAGATEPDPRYGYSWWLDTGALLIKHRNSANSAWATVGTFTTDGYVSWYSGASPLGLFATLKANFSGTADPGVGDDSADGYAAGSIWLNTTAGRAWICSAATLGAAVWRPITTATFAQDTAGLVPGPTAADIAAVRVLSAAGTWVAAEWTALQTMAPPSALASLEFTSGSPSAFRRLRLRFDGLSPSISGIAVTAQLRVSGVWKTGSSDYDWTGTYVTNGSQPQTGGAAAAIPISYSGWPATSEIGGELDVTTQGSRSIIKARGAYSRSGGRGLFDLDGYCNFTGSPDGVRISVSAGTFSAAGRAVLEGSTT